MAVLRVGCGEVSLACLSFTAKSSGCYCIVRCGQIYAAASTLGDFHPQKSPDAIGVALWIWDGKWDL